VREDDREREVLEWNRIVCREIKETETQKRPERDWGAQRGRKKKGRQGRVGKWW
jgi:hypothetical protein